MLASASVGLSNLQVQSFYLSPRPFPPSPAKGTTRRKLRHERCQRNFLGVLPLPSTNRSQLSQLPAAAPLHHPSPLEAEDDRPLDPSGRRLDAVTLSSLLKSCSTLNDVKCSHAAAVRLFCSSSIFSINNLISAYARFSDLGNARKLFDGMPERNVISWTAILTAFLNADCENEVLRLFKQMVENHVEGNSLTFVCILKTCGGTSDFQLGRQIHACVVKGNWSNLIMDSAIVYFYAQCGDLLGASRAFHRMADRDVITWTTMITAYVQHGHSYRALSLFCQMQHQSIFPNEFTLCSTLKACGDIKMLGFGRQLHGALLKGMPKEDVYVKSALVHMYMRCGEVSDARIVFDLMPKRNTVTWTSMISGCSKNGLAKEAIVLFHKMKSRHVFANNFTIVSVLRACGSIGSLTSGKEVHGQILKNGVHENIHIGSTLIWFYCKCGKFTYATEVLKAMPEKDVISWTAIISGYASLGHGSEALRFLNGMLREGVQPNPFTYSSALKACSQLEDVKCGKWIHASVNKTRALSNVFVGSALIDMYMRCRCIADASKVFDTMPERNLVSWKMMIIGYAKNGHCKEALKLMYRMQEEGFHVDDFVLATVLGSCGDLRCELEYASASDALSCL